MRNNSSGCLTAFVSAFSRIMLLMIWIARPIAWNGVFGSWIWPCLGFLIVPFTTLMYFVLITNGTGGIQGLDWLWLFLAVLLDVGSWGAAGYSNRNYLPGGQTVDTPTSPYTPPPASMSAASAPAPAPAAAPSPTPAPTQTTPPPAASEKPQEPPK